jgi:hypothetical protein
MRGKSNRMAQRQAVDFDACDGGQGVKKGKEGVGFTLRLMPACHVLGLRESTGVEMDRGTSKKRRLGRCGEDRREMR